MELSFGSYHKTSKLSKIWFVKRVHPRSKQNGTNAMKLNLKSCKIVSWKVTWLKFTCSKLTIETLEKGVKYV